jgi:putative transposase
VIPFLVYLPEVRRIIYTTNALENLPVSLVARLRKIIKNRGRFHNDKATTTLLYRALRNITRA